jgi:hypothetical protein
MTHGSASQIFATRYKNLKKTRAALVLMEIETKSKTQIPDDNNYDIFCSQVNIKLTTFSTTVTTTTF